MYKAVRDPTAPYQPITDFAKALNVNVATLRKAALASGSIISIGGVQRIDTIRFLEYARIGVEEVTDETTATNT